MHAFKCHRIINVGIWSSYNGSVFHVIFKKKYIYIYMILISIPRYTALSNILEFNLT